MKLKGRYLVIIVLLFLATVISVSYSYFGPIILGEDDKETSVTTGKVDIKVDDDSISAKDIAPIYDNDYEMLAFHKSFSIISNPDSLNSCTKIYLNISNISDSLKSEYFKYKIITDDFENVGDFSNANNGEKLLIADNQFIESGTNVNYELYIWVSYEEDIDQMSMLGTSINANILIEGQDTKEGSVCK